MTTELPLSIAYTFYDRNAAISDGRVVPEGTRPVITHHALGELFKGMITNPTYDVSEMSLSSYTIARARGDHRLIGLPIFLSRAFRYNSIYVAAESGISGPEDLQGRRIGVPMYQQTAGVWARGILQDEHALDLDSMTWCTGQLATLDGGERQPLNLPEHVSVEPLGIGRSLVGALDAGDIDAIISPWVPPEFRERRGTIRRLFDDFPKRDREYFAKTGVFPPMHLVVIRSGVYQQNRWLAKSLVDAFDEAKRIALADIADISYLRMMVPFVAGLLEEQLAIFGADPWPYGVEENRRSLEVFVRYMGEQGLLESPISVEDLFAEEVITA